MFVLAFLFALWSAPAHALSLGLDPQNRIHLGVSMVEGPAPIGFTGGFDSRLSRVLCMDLGLFVSPFAIPEDYAFTPTSYEQNYKIRSGIYLTPGLRIPHPQPKSWAWEVFARGGFGVLWTANLDPDSYDQATSSAPRASPAGVVDVDALARFGPYGIRAFGKGWIFSASRLSPDEQYVLVRPQWGLEGVFQW